MSLTSDKITTLTTELQEFLTGESTDDAAKDAHIKDLEAKEAAAEARLASVDADDAANAAAVQAEIDIIRALKTQANKHAVHVFEYGYARAWYNRRPCRQRRLTLTSALTDGLVVSGLALAP